MIIFEEPVKYNGSCSTEYELNRIITRNIQILRAQFQKTAKTRKRNGRAPKIFGESKD